MIGTAAPLAILESGLVCGVGLSSGPACAAIRCALDNFRETKFVDRYGEFIVGSAAPLTEPWFGRVKLHKMLALAVAECLESANISDTTKIPALLCIAENDRPGGPPSLENDLQR
jgi:3-oxoacyl-[acyl-carrier-protein] synthase-1